MAEKLDKKRLFSDKCYSKDFNLMILGQTISILGSSLLRFALSLYVLDITGRADLFATIFAISNIPRLLMPIGGAIADRFNRRNLMVIYDFSSSFIVVLLFLLMSTGNPSIIVIGAVMILLSIISSMYTPAVSASVPLLIQENKIESANGIVTAVQALSDVTAPVIGGLFYHVMGVNALVIISGIAFSLSAVMEIFIKIPFIKRRQKCNIIKTIFTDMKEGFVYAIKEPFILKAMILAALINLILSPVIFVGTPIIFRVTMQSTDVMYGVGMGLINFAAILGALTIGFFTKSLKMKLTYRWLIATALLLVPVALSLMPFVVNFGYYPAFSLFMFGVIPISFILTLLSIFVISKVQKKTSNENLGKVTAIIMAVAHCTTPIGQVVYGNILESFQTQTYLPILLTSFTLLALAFVAYRVLKNDEE